MCGIAGYVGGRKVAPLLVESLRKLEYRGYDSCGVATLAKGRIWVKKDKGKIEDVNRKLRLTDMPGSIGFGHTRWATHGKVSKRNSHPQTDCKEDIAVIHNGIIENFSELKKRLKKKSHKFRSDTDTEVIAHLIEDNLRSGVDIEEAVRKAMNSLKGRSAIIVIKRDFPGLIAARTGSPLILGVGENEYFIASDVPAFLDYTRRVMYLDDGEMVVLKGEPKFRGLMDGKDIKKRVITIDWDAKQADKGEHEHYMIKEIMEQKETIMRALNQDEREIKRVANEINKAFGVFLTGCGTAGKVCQTGEYVFSKVAGKHVNYVVSSEFPNYRHFLTRKTLLITVSQSGETADVLEAVKTAKEKGVKIISLVNVKGSTLDRVSDMTFLIKAGPEKAVASTKATTAQLAILYLLAYACTGKLNEGKKLLLETASKINDMLNPRYEEHIKKLAREIYRKKNVYIIGRALNYPMALESAIKIMEVSYIHAQGFAGGELKHGPIALIEKGSPCIVLTANDGTNNIMGNAMEIKARGGFIIGVGPKRNEVFDYWLKTPDVGIASPIVNIIPVQLLAYHLGVLRGCDIDQPRNLAKSVTVE